MNTYAAPRLNSLPHRLMLGTALLAALGCLLLHGAPVAAAAPPAAADEAASAGMWDLSDLYPSPESWAEAYARGKAAAEALEGYKGTLGQSATAMLSALDAISVSTRYSAPAVCAAPLAARVSTRARSEA